MSDVQGWMREVDLEWLLEAGQQARVSVEVGVWKGRSLRALCDGGGCVYGVDHWRGAPAERTLRHAEVATDEGRAKVMQGVRETFADELDSGRLTLLDMSSTEAAPLLGQVLAWRGGADLVFIDADHDDIEADIRAWTPVVASGGILAGHDASRRVVKKAIDRLVPGYSTTKDSIWWRTMP